MEIINNAFRRIYYYEFGIRLGFQPYMEPLNSTFYIEISLIFFKYDFEVAFKKGAIK